MSDKLTDDEIKELQDKKKAIREDLFDKVKMVMFAASSVLEGTYEECEEKMKQMKALDEMVRFNEEHGLYDD